MCDRLLSEDLLAPGTAAVEPGIYRIRRGVPKAASISAVYRLMTTGLLAVDGRRVVLESIVTASGRMTSKQAIRRFISALNGFEPGELEESNQLVAAGSGGNAEAAAILDRLGI